MPERNLDQLGDPLDGLLDQVQTDPNNPEGGNQSQGQGQQPVIPQEMLQLAIDNGKNQAIQELMKDPDFAQLYRMKHAGQKLKIVPENAQQQHQVGPDGQPVQQQQTQLPADMSKMTPQQLVAALTPLIGQQTQATVAPAMQELQQGRQLINQFMVQQETQRAQADIQAAMQKYPDFASHRQEITQLVQQNPALSAEQAYVLARLAKGTLSGKQQKPTYSERPVSNPARPQSRQQGQQQQQRQLSKAELWDKVLDSALSDINIPDFNG